jgi:NAD(P)-dependent dehydrogenase (short-subunit alcohol dehydrogenase family)
VSGRGPVVLVTGGNRGIGLEACRALAAGGARVLLGSRDLSDGKRAAAEIGKGVEAVALDVADPKSVDALKARVEKEFGALDALVNNAGVYSKASALETNDSEIQTVLSANLMGAWRMCRAFAPAMAKKGRGRIVNVSSGMGALSSMDAGSAAYRVSKAALNALTLTLAAELKPAGVAVVSLCPGWVRTRMGGETAPRSPELAGKTVADAVLSDSRTAVFIRDGQELAW